MIPVDLTLSPILPRIEIPLIEESPDTYPSPWDPAYLLYLKYADLPVEEEWIPELRGIPEARQRLNAILNTRQGNWDFHSWVKGIAEKLREKGMKLGVSYCIPGSSVPKILGREGLTLITSKIELNTGKSIPELHHRIAERDFKANDVDFRLEITEGVFNDTSREIAKIVNQLPEHQVTVIGNIAVLVTFGNWDLFISIQSERNYIFDAEGAYIRIPFDRISPPYLQVIHPTAFYRSLMFDVAEMSDFNNLNPHVLRAFLYRSICGKRVQHQDVLQYIFKLAAPLKRDLLSHHFELSFKKHAMPEGSDARHLFLLQLLCENVKRPDWQETCINQHGEPKATVWSRTLSLKDVDTMRFCLLWIGAVALLERWRAPFKATLSERGGIYVMRLQINDKCLWIPLEQKIPDELPKSLWSWLQSIPWNKVEREESSFVYDRELSPMLEKILPQLQDDTPLKRFFSARLNRMNLDWEGLAKKEEAWESELIMQCVGITNSEEMILKALPYADQFTFRHAVNWRLQQKRRLTSAWQSPFIWERLHNSCERGLLYTLLLRSGRAVWDSLEDTLRQKHLHFLTRGKLTMVEEVKVLRLTDAPLPLWESLLKNKEAEVHAATILRCSVGMIAPLAKKLHHLALACFQKKEAPNEAVILLDHWLDNGETTRALELWACCDKAGLLRDWKRDWELLEMCEDKECKSFQLLAAKCSKTTCPDISTWVKKAPIIIPKIKDRDIQLQLLRVSQHDDLLMLFLNLSPPLEESWGRVSKKEKGPVWCDYYNALAPAMLQQNDPLWIQRMWECLLIKWPSQDIENIHLRPLIEKTVNTTMNLELVNLLKKAILDKVKGITNHYPLLLKVCASESYPDIITLLGIWVETIHSHPYQKVTVQENKIIKALFLQENLKTCSIAILQPIYHYRYAFEDPCALLFDLIEDPQDFRFTSKRILVLWVPLLLEWLEKKDPDLRLKGTSRIMQLLITMPSIAYDQRIEEVKQLILSLNGKNSPKVAFALLNAMLTVMQPNSSINLIENFFSFILTQVPEQMAFDDINAARLILKAAQACHLFAALSETETPYRFRNIPILKRIPYLEIKRKFVNVVVNWINNLTGRRRTLSDELFQGYLLLNCNTDPYPLAYKFQGDRCFTEMLFWAVEETEKNPKTTAWFTYWFIEHFFAKSRSDEILRFIKAIPEFFFMPPPNTPYDPDKAFIKLMRAWAGLYQVDLMEIFAKIIERQLKAINNEYYYRVFLGTLEKYTPNSPIIKRLEVELGDQTEKTYIDWAVNHELTPEELEQEFNDTWMIKGNILCFRICMFGLSVLALYPATFYANSFAGRELPVVTTINKYAFKAGLGIVGAGGGGFVLLILAMAVNALFQCIHNRHHL